MELLGEYYHHKCKVDFRSLHYHGVISADTPPGGGTTDHSVHIFREAAKHDRYTCFLRDKTCLELIFLPDCIKATLQCLRFQCPACGKSCGPIQAVSFTPAELVEMRKHFTELQVEYELGRTSLIPGLRCWMTAVPVQTGAGATTTTCPEWYRKWTKSLGKAELDIKCSFVFLRANFVSHCMCV